MSDTIEPPLHPVDAAAAAHRERMEVLRAEEQRLAASVDG